METCSLCRTMFKVFQVLTYMTFFWMVGMILLDRAPDFLRGVLLLLPKTTGRIQHEADSQDAILNRIHP